MMCKRMLTRSTSGSGDMTVAILIITDHLLTFTTAKPVHTQYSKKMSNLTTKTDTNGSGATIAETHITMGHSLIFTMEKHRHIQLSRKMFNSTSNQRTKTSSNGIGYTTVAIPTTTDHLRIGGMERLVRTRFLRKID